MKNKNVIELDDRVKTRRSALFSWTTSTSEGVASGSHQLPPGVESKKEIRWITVSNSCSVYVKHVIKHLFYQEQEDHRNREQSWAVKNQEG
jgi:hypothetical protein